MRGFLLVILFANLLGLTFAIPSTVSACSCYTEDSELVTIDDYCADVCGEDEATSSAFESDSSEGICTCSDGSEEYAGCEYACDIDEYSTEDTKTIVDDGSSSSTSSTTNRKLLTPVLSIDIPTVTFSDIVVDGDVLKINFLGDYIAGIYKYLLGISTTIAIVMIMVSGLQWSLGGQSPEAIGKAKTRIKNAVTGLVLLLCTYLILYTVNPNLTSLRFPELETIQYVQLVKDSGDASGTISTENLEAAGIDCPGSGDVATIARSFLGRTTYRLGAKGGSAPYSSETKIDSSGRHYSEYCPEGTVCLDCSGFVSMVAQCAGLASKGESGGTSGIFTSAPSIASCGSDSVTLGDGTTHTLTAGDLVGFKTGDWTESNSGHVWMYIGNGELINSVDSGRASGTSVITQSLKSACSKFPLRFVDR